jgi:hypothetical protein
MDFRKGSLKPEVTDRTTLSQVCPGFFLSILRATLKLNKKKTAALFICFRVGRCL